MSGNATAQIGGNHEMQFEYPIAAGHRSNDTVSRSVAASIDASSHKVETQVRCLVELHQRGEESADSLGSILDEDRLYLRPRLSELKKLELIRFSGNRTKAEHSRQSMNLFELEPEVAEMIDELTEQGTTLEQACVAMLEFFKAEYERKLELTVIELAGRLA